MSEGIKLGSKVEVIGKGLYGVVSYVGSTSFASGKWIGVTLNEPLGKNDGEVQGKRYFTCDPNCGVFVRPPQVQVLESPTVRRKTGDERLSTSSLPTSNRRERSSSPSRQSRLLGPSALQKPKTRLSFAPKPRPQAPPEPSVETVQQPVVPAPTPKIESAVQSKVSDPAPLDPIPSSTPMTLAPGISMVEIDSLKGQIKEWKEKYETIRMKRQEDRSKLKDFEKMRIQLQQLQDGKARALEQVQDLSKQLREAKKAKEEAIEAKDSYMEDMADVQETIEMATLDKEMAEEKADILQKEVENLNDKVEELQTDLEIMKAEIEDQGSDGAATNYQVKQLAEQNNKLKEALVRLRDLSTAEKSEYIALEKQLDKKSKELNEMTQKKEKLQVELEKVEATMDELKEQVDASLAAEEMVESLTERNLEQEEKIVDMEEQIHDLESINDMNEELQENARENELELREEVDLMRAKVLEAKRQAEAANEVVVDYQDTIQRFRKVVQELQDANHELRTAQNEQDEKTEVESVAAPPPAFNYQIKMVETQAAARSIDHELRKLDLAQANTLGSYLRMYMPSSIEKTGDNDCIEVLLFVKRVSSKAKIIAKHVADKFDLNAELDKSTDLLGVRGDQLSFGSYLVNKLVRLQVLMDCYDEALSKCSVDLLLKVGTLYGEMRSHEQVLNIFIDLLRKDTLDETCNIDSLEKLMQFFYHLFNVHLSREEQSCLTTMERHLDLLQPLVGAIVTNTQRLKTFLQPGHETSDVAILLKDVATSCGDMKQLCRKIQRRMPQPSTDGKTTRLQFTQSAREALDENLKKVGSIHGVAFEWVRHCAKFNLPSDNSSLSASKMQELLLKAADEVYKVQDVNGLIRASLGDVVKAMNSLLVSMQEGDFDAPSLPSKVSTPLEKRSLAMKAEMVDSEGLSSKLEEKDVVIMELRKAVKLKSDDVAEAKIRVGMLERKLEKATKESSNKASLLQQQLDSLTEDLQKKEKDYDETLDALQSDIETLEAEKTELKQRLSSQAKRSVLTDLAFKSPVSVASPTGTRGDVASVLASTTGPAKVTDSPMLSQQISVMQTALRVKSRECAKLTGDKLVRDLKDLTPLRGLKMKSSSNDVRDVRGDLKKLSSTLSEMMVPQVANVSQRKAGRYPVGSSSPYHRLLDQEWRLRILNEDLKEISVRAQQAVARSRRLEVKSDYASFALTSPAKSLSLGEPQLIGGISLAADGSVAKDNLLKSHSSKTSVGPSRSSYGPRDICLDLDQLNKLHQIMLKRAVHLP